MASLATSETIFFIVGAIIAAGLVGVFATTASQLGSDVETRGQAIAKELRSDILIINDPYNMNATNLSLYVKNVGNTRLFSNLTTVMLDGAVLTNATYSIHESTDNTTWRPGEVLKVFVVGVVTTGDHRARVVAETGVSSEVEFRRG